MKEDKPQYPVEHDNTILEKISERYFTSKLPIPWIVEKPSNDYGIDLNITLVVNNEVIGLNFSVQLKAKNDCKGKLEVSLKKTTLNYLFGRLEPAMLVLYDNTCQKAYWKWLIKGDFDLTEEKANYLIKFDGEQSLENIDWGNIQMYVQRIFKVHQNLVTSLEYDLFNTQSDLETKAWAHYFKRNYPEAIFNFRRLVATEYRPIWLLALAQCEYEHFEYDRAIHSINLALEKDQSDNILLTKACILSEAGRKESDIYKVKTAEKIFAELYKQSPTIVNTYNYANTVQNLKELERAEQLFKETIALDKNHAEAWRNLGQIYFDQSRFEDALKCYETALRVNPYLLQAIVSKAIVLGAGFQKCEEALDLLNEAILSSPTIFTEFPPIFYWLSYFHSQLGNVDEALLWVNRGLDHSPGDFHLRSQKAQIFIYLMAQHPHIVDQAIEFFKENESVNKRDNLNYYYLCEALILKADLASAMEKLLDWYQPYFPYSREIIDLHFSEYKLEELMAPLRHWELIRGYLTLYKLPDVSTALEGEGLSHIVDFLTEFQINRILFLDSFHLTAADESKRNTLIQEKSQLVQQFLSRFTGKSLGKMITADKDKELEAFAEQFSNVTYTLSLLTIKEIAMCIGFAIGHIFPNNDMIIHKLTGESNFTNAFLKFSERLYIELGLPMDK